jgi:hypothetical protein
MVRVNADGSGVTNLTGDSPDDFYGSWGPSPASYDFSGFFSPVDNLPTFNQVKAGRTIPMKFSLGGDQGLDIFAEGYPKSQRIDCDSTDPVDTIERTVSTGESSLSYDATTDQYIYSWKTAKEWRGCRQLVVRFDDAEEYKANFKFVR